MRQRFLNSLNRNTFLFIAGMAGVAHETLLEHSERPTLLILFAAMMGLPAFLTSTEIFPHEHKDPDRKEEDRNERIEKQAQKDTEERVSVAVEEQEEIHGED